MNNAKKIIFLNVKLIKISVYFIHIYLNITIFRQIKICISIFIQHSRQKYK